VTNEGLDGLIHKFVHKIKGKRKRIAVCSRSTTPLQDPVSHVVPGRDSIFYLFFFRCYGRYSIYPPYKDERLSRPELTQVNDLPRVATEVPAIPGVGWLSEPFALLGTVGVNS